MSGADGPKLVAQALDPVLVPLGFAPGQVGGAEDGAQVIFCRGELYSPDGGCIDLVVDMAAQPEWRITDVRYWGFASDRWHLPFDRDVPLADQLAGLGRTMATQLESGE